MILSSSRLELLDHCEGAFSLPWRDEPNEYSLAGSERHSDDEQAINDGLVPEVYELQWPGLTWSAEAAYMYDAATGTSRLVGYGIGRNYGEQRPFEIPGTIDAEGRGLDRDGRSLLVVVDRKGFEPQSPVTKHPQVRFLALAAARAAPAERIEVAIRSELGPMDIAELDPVLDLDLIAHETRGRILRAGRIRSDMRNGKPIEFNTGRWCRWCPAFAACPRQHELHELTTRDAEDPELALSILVDDSNAASAYELYKRIGILYKRLGEQLYARAAHRPIYLGNGRVFGPRSKDGNERLDGDVVYDVVKELYGQQIADRAVERKATKAGLERALKGIRQAHSTSLKLIRQRGGVLKANDKVVIEEFEPESE